MFEKNHFEIKMKSAGLVMFLERVKIVKMKTCDQVGCFAKDHFEIKMKSAGLVVCLERIKIVKMKTRDQVGCLQKIILQNIHLCRFFLVM